MPLSSGSHLNVLTVSGATSPGMSACSQHSGAVSQVREFGALQRKDPAHNSTLHGRKGGRKSLLAV